MMVYVDRRGSRRVKAILSIRFFSPEDKFLSKTKNISLLGTSVELNKKVSPGFKTEVVLELPSYKSDTKTTEQISCEGVVVRCRALESAERQGHYDIGIFFRNFFGDGEKKLSAYINYLLNKKEEACQKYLKEKALKVQKKEETKKAKKGK